MEHLTDTNILWRGGIAGLDFVQRSAADFNRNGGIENPNWQERLLELHREFIARNLSPGGSADLVAATWAAYQFETLPSRTR
jgi:triphosphoribosyl-dephospho-CoA synthase